MAVWGEKEATVFKAQTNPSELAKPPGTLLTRISVQEESVMLSLQNGAKFSKVSLQWDSEIWY